MEAIHWPHGPFCPHCGNANPERITKLAGKSTRPGVYKCNECRAPFSVTVGTVFERSKIGLHKWVLASHLYASSKKGMSAHQLHRMLGVTYKTAWFMAHRIREAMKEDVKSAGPLGGEGKTVEADETYIGKRETPRISEQRMGRPFTKKGKGGGAHKRIVVGLVERGGKARMFHLNDATASTVRDVLVRNVSRDTTLYTDSSRLYTRTGEEYASHKTTNHALANTCATKAPRPSTQILLRACSQCSSAAWLASISIAAKLTCTATLPSSISATIAAPR